LSWSAATARNKWYNEYNEYAFVGKDRTGGNYDGWQALFKPLAEDFEHDEQLNTLHTVGIRMSVCEKERVIDPGNESSQFTVDFTIINEDDVMLWDRGSGYTYDGVNPWSTYPIAVGAPVDFAIPGESATDPIVMAELPREYHSYLHAKVAAGDVLFDNDNPPFDENEADMFRNGFKIETGNFYYGPGDWTYKISNKDVFSLRPISTRIYYMNGIVNSLSRSRMTTAGGVDLELDGLALRLPNADLADYCYGAADYRHRTDKIHFIGREGQGTYTLDYGPYAGPYDDFTATNTKIVIASMPPMAKGTYNIQLEQYDMERGNSYPYTTYAGDWRANSQGRIQPGTRHVFVVSDDPIPPAPPSPFFVWDWGFYEYYAPIDVRASETFWDGYVLGSSGVTRAIDDTTGLYNISDMSVDLANNNKHFSQLLAGNYCKNRRVAVTYGRGQEPEAWQVNVFRGIVDDHDLDLVFKATLKDITQKYMKIQTPKYLITEEEYPNVKEEAKGLPVPEILGVNNLTATATPGSIQAHCVDTAAYKYVMARWPLQSVTAVYEDGVWVNPVTYSLTAGADGKYYVTFGNDKGEKKITFNCTGYSFGVLDSANGYIQNPAYVILYYLAIILQIPVNWLDWDSFDEVATTFDDAGWGTSGRLAITALEDAEQTLQKLLYSFGIKLWVSRDGLITIGKKCLSDLDPAPYIFAQIDTFDPPQRISNWAEMVNTANVLMHFHPACDHWEHARTVRDGASVRRFGEVGPDEPWKFPWTTSQDLVSQRVAEDLVKLSEGDKRVKFTCDISHIEELDIFSNFRLQDPYGLSETGIGEVGRYYYVASVTYNFENASMDVEAVDLQYLVGQCFILGNEDDLPDLWADATYYQRYWGYLCDEVTEAFSDDYTGKRMCDENLFEEQ
jgi:hypothetical protein